MKPNATHARGRRAVKVTFEDEKRAIVVEAAPGDDADDLLDQLGLEPSRPVIVVVGGADTLTDDALKLSKRVVGPAVARAAAVTGAAVVDGGTDSGIMAIVGEALHEWRVDAVLLGVAPVRRVTFPGSPYDGNGNRAELEPNHTHFALADSDEWGGETGLLIELSEALAGPAHIAMVVAGGGEAAKQEVLQATRHGWIVFLVVGTGGTADELAAAWRALHEGRPTRLARVLPKRLTAFLPERWRRRKPAGQVPGNVAVEEVVRTGDLRPYDEGDPAELARRLTWEVQDHDVLKLAWKSFATYDELAAAARKSFERMQTSILALGILATFVALLKAALDIEPQSGYGWVDDVLHWTVVALPILVAVLVGMTYRLALGKRWVLLRGAAETIKREIYRFRTATGVYGEAAAEDAPLRPQELLSAQLDAIETKLLQTEASSAELTPYSGPLPPRMYGASSEDDGLSPLDPERYLAFRVGDQLSYFHPKVARLARTRRRFQLGVLAAGGVGAILAAAGFEVWIGLTTAIGSAGLAYLGYLQIESTLVVYNQVAGKLEALRRSWVARPAARREDPKAFDALVADAEAVLATELGGWVQQMTDALEELHATQLEAERQAGIDQTLLRPTPQAVQPEDSPTDEPVSPGDDSEPPPDEEQSEPGLSG